MAYAHAFKSAISVPYNSIYYCVVFRSKLPLVELVTLNQIGRAPRSLPSVLATANHSDSLCPF